MPFCCSLDGNPPPVGLGINVQVIPGEIVALPLHYIYTEKKNSLDSRAKIKIARSMERNKIIVVYKDTHMINKR